MSNYYDIHTHILPGIDDGSRSEDETYAMLKMAYAEGVTHIICTPHYEVGGNNRSRAELDQAIDMARRQAVLVSPDIKLSLGNELLNSAGMVDELKAGNALTMGNTRYILVEFLPTDSYELIYSALRNYIMNGYIPIVAHMERYESLFKQFENIEEIIKLGVYFQMNTESLVGGFLNRRATYHRKLLQEGYIHFLGSDCHRRDRRTPLMKEALTYMGREFMESGLAEKILRKNPEIMLADKYI